MYRKDIIEEKAADWEMTNEKLKEDWVTTVASRLMNMQSHLVHAKDSAKHPKWLHELLDGQISVDEFLEEVNEFEADQKDECGFDIELLECWRKARGNKIEIAISVEIGEAEHDPITAVFADDTRMIVNDCTTAKYKTLTTAPGERPCKSVS